MDDLLRVGVITSPHGVRGEVKVFPTTDDKSRFKKLDRVILDLGKEQRELEIESVKFFKNMAILKFKGLDDIGAVETLRRKDLLVTRAQAVRLEKDEYFIADLIGLSVVTDEGKTLGAIADVMQTGANDVYCVRTGDGGELLIPAIAECIRNVDLGKREMLVHMLEGLLDL